MAELRTINLTFTQEQFDRLLKAKEKAMKQDPTISKWEDFVFKQVCGK